MAHRLRLAAALILLMVAGLSPAVAQVLGLHAEPAAPRAGQTFVLELTAATCHVFWDETEPLAREVSVAGNTITVTVAYTAPPPGGGGCEANTERAVRWNIGPFPADSYMIELVGKDPVSGSEGEGIDQVSVSILPAPTLLFDPATPKANQAFTLTYPLAGCGDVFPGYALNNRIVEVTGAVIRVTVDHGSDSCVPGQTFDPAYSWTIDPLPAGSYQVELIAEDGNAPSTLVLATRDVVVAPGIGAVPSANTVPVLNAWGLSLLVGLTLAGAVLLLRRKL